MKGFFWGVVMGVSVRHNRIWLPWSLHTTVRDKLHLGYFLYAKCYAGGKKNHHHNNMVIRWGLKEEESVSRET